MDRLASLERSLDRYRPVDERDAAYVVSMRGLAARGAGCLDRSAFEPGHFTASAFILDPDDRVLLILHAKLGRWLQPGGHIEPGDADVEAAARREVREEVGIADLARIGAGLFDVDVHRIPAGRDPAHQHFDVRFAFRTHTRQAVPRSDALDAQWLALDAVHTVESDASVMRAVARLRRELAR